MSDASGLRTWPQIHVDDLIDSLVGRGRAVLAVSPHLDDAAFSAGATISELTSAGVDVHVHTVFAGVPSGQLSPSAMAIHQAAGLPTSGGAVEMRRSEDAAGMGTLGVTWDHGESLDAIYRRDEHGDWLCGELWSVFNLDPFADERLLERITTHVRQALASRDPGLVLSCAALGRHVDHALTAAAVQDATQPMGVPVLLWEDLPYGMWVEEGSAGQALAVACSSQSWDRKVRAMASYRSQVASFWPDGSDWSHLFLAHGARRGETSRAELFWRRDR